MHKFYLALILLSVPASTAVLARSGTDQEQQACTRDVQRFLPQTDGSRRFYHSGLPQGKSSKAFFRVPRRADQPRAIANNR